MKLEAYSWTRPVSSVLCQKNRGWHNAYESDGCEHSMSLYQGMVSGQILESVAHTIIAHCREIETDEVRKQEGVA